jgi:hypothetical protein
MQRNARTNINAAWGGAGAFGVASLPGNLIACGFGKHLRRRRSQRAFASVTSSRARGVPRLLRAWRVCRFVGWRGQRVGTAA